MRKSKRQGHPSRQDLSDEPLKVSERMVVSEINRLQKQFRIAMEKRKSYSTNLKQQILAQEKKIESLTQEQKEVSLTIGQIMSPKNRMLDDRNCKEAQYLLQIRYQYDCLIRERKALLAVLDNQIEELEKKVVKQNLIASKVKQANCSKQLQKQIDTLEMRLYNANVHFNTILAKNDKLREEIESLQIQKAVLDNFYFKLHTKLDQQKKRMNTAVEQTTQAYEQLSEAQTRIAAMIERHKTDTAQYHIEMQEQERILARETKLKAFMLARFTDRSELEEQAKKKRDLKAAQRAKKSGGECFETWEVAYKRLLELAEDGNVDQLLSSFVEKEQKSFACFLYASELNDDMQKLQRKIKELQLEIASLMKGQKHAKTKSFHLVKELETNLTESTEEANCYEDLCKERSKILGQLKSSMEILIRKIDCDTTDIMKQLGEKGEITDLNLMQYFGLMEKKTNELLLLESILRYTLTEGTSLDLPFTNPLLGSPELLQEINWSQICPPPPTLNDNNNAIDALEVPLDHSQLCQMVLQNHKKDWDNAAGTDENAPGME
ncbi:coiled-coil domain-containing protein 63 isoform X1 [Pezoporus wallicus]|uniref:coiled-coil domain-containing protein 63 isoform X1 n=2 Tax=Pezoporus wallicus TaxID=35540 RepID=UPI00254B36A5|nr:coiled-coil domain-containing protein 63 isoform X1 [Pezoporus wallicus]XP_057277235.1 coiled-coil domain-containing protein 63 isoform X1 [Pezoporus wallicus]XP_057277236.1 coiled-coil domain-containing protein 63 isoform X1 [Pezoporus wallicus]